MSFLEAMQPPASPDDEEPGGLGVDIQARLFATLDRMDKRAARQYGPPQAPVFFRAAASVIIANTIGWVPLGGPDQGHYWYLTQLGVGGVSKGVAAAGVADLYVSSTSLPSLSPAATAANAEPSLVDWRDTFAAMPAVHFYGDRQVPLRMGEELWVRFSGATNGQQYVAAAQVTDYQEAALAQDWAR